ncbi:MAG: EAL domain-containing protein [Actinomycetota bacterium]
MRRLSVAPKIGVPLVMVTVVVAALFGLNQIAETKARLNETYVTDAQGLGRVVANEYRGLNGDRATLTGELQDLVLNHPTLERVRLFRTHPSGVWASTDVSDLDLKVAGPEYSVDTVSQRDVEIEGVPRLETIVPNMLGNGVVSMGFYYSLDQRDEAIATVTRRTAIAGVAAVALEFLVLFPMFYFLVLRRVRHLGKAAGAVAEGDFSVRLPDDFDETGRDELANVAREFDRMISTVSSRTKQQGAVAQLGQHALAGKDLNELLDETAAVIAALLDVEYSEILELTDGDALVLRAGMGWHQGAVGFAALNPGRESHAGYTLVVDEPVVIENLAEEKRFAPTPLLIEHRVVAGIDVPIPGQERHFGVIGVHTTRERVFTTDDINFLQAAANVLAAGIERKRSEEQVAFMAHHDELTGLPNRAMFEELLDMALARARRNDMASSVLFLDIDNFKLVNDSLGHEAGDELLGQIAIRLREATRDTDLVARQGGDEFLVLLADIETSGASQDVEGALMVAESVITRIQQELEAPFLLRDTEVYVTVSIGVSMFPAYANDGRTLLKNADTAMYRSKKAGPGGYVVYSTEVGDPLGKLSLTTRLRKAVEGDHLVLHYQPILDLKTLQIVGVEALLRWQDPTQGMIPPGEFIPLAEEIGLIGAIGEWVIDDMCKQARSWRDDGLEIEMSFNLSPRQLWQPDLVTKILGYLEKSSVPPEQVIIEITESAAMTDPDRTQQILWDLHGRGLRLAIDDFGTGYSSLSRLKHMPVSTLKIDRSFVMDIPQDPDAGSMVTAVIQLAHSLGMTSLAEGIETDEQWRFLVEQGCQHGQGFYFSRPVPADEIIALHRRNGMNLAQEISRD